MGINGQKNFFPARRQRTHSSSVFGLFEKRGDVQTLREKLKEFKRQPHLEDPDFDRHFAEKAKERREDGAVIHRPRGHSTSCRCVVCKAETMKPLVVEKPIREKALVADYTRKMANLARGMHSAINAALPQEPEVRVLKLQHTRHCKCPECMSAASIRGKMQAKGLQK